MSAQAGVLLSKWPPPPGMTYQTQRADLGGQGRRGTDFPTGTPQVYDFDLVGVELRRHGGGGWCRMNPDSGRPKKVAPSPPPSRKPKDRLRGEKATVPGAGGEGDKQGKGREQCQRSQQQRSTPAKRAGEHNLLLTAGKHCNS